VNVALPPAQPFSCAVHDFREQGLVLEVGSSCSASPYGFFVYIWVHPCSGRCPLEASNYGLIAVAPSRGWTWRDFGTIVELSMVGKNYLPIDIPATLDVPISPPVRGTPNPDGTITWTATGPPTSHTVSFRWRGTNPADPNILSDTGAPIFGPLTAEPNTWPTALGHITAPDVSGVGGELIHSTGSGCFSVAGIPTPSDADPIGLVVDLRNAATPAISEPRSSGLAAACP